MQLIVVGLWQEQVFSRLACRSTHRSHKTKHFLGTMSIYRIESFYTGESRLQNYLMGKDFRTLYRCRNFLSMYLIVESDLITSWDGSYADVEIPCL